jgi:hypothetical protein
MKNLAYIIIIFSFTQLGCGPKSQTLVGHKFPEDTEATTKSSTERLIDKWWILNKVSINGIDLTDSVKKQIGECSFKLTNQGFGNSGAYPPGSMRGVCFSDTSGQFPIYWIQSDLTEAIGLTDLAGCISCAYYPFSVFFPNHLTSSSFNMKGQMIRKLNQHELKVRFENNNADTIIVNEYTN